MSVCRYDAGGELEQSELLSVDDTASAVAALQAAPAGNAEIPASCAQDQLPRLVVDLITTDLNSEVIYQAPCPYSPGITSGGESFQELTADVLYWALSPGWSGSVDQGVPLPGKLRELHSYAAGPEPETSGACAEQFGPTDEMTVGSADDAGVMCRYTLDWAGESGGTWLLDDEHELLGEDEGRLVDAVEAAPPSPGLESGTCRDSKGGKGELFVMTHAGETYWIYNSECDLSGVEVEHEDQSLEGHVVTDELLNALGSPYGLLR
jgi:hypothetical protein